MGYYSFLQVFWQLGFLHLCLDLLGINEVMVHHCLLECVRGHTIFHHYLISDVGIVNEVLGSSLLLPKSRHFSYGILLQLLVSVEDL